VAIEQVKLDVIVHYEDGMYWAEAPDHPGLFASGETVEELVEAVGEAWVLYNHSDDATETAAGMPKAAMHSMQILVPA
jgi:predicted RNase H-like HicB family nuclease